MSLAEFSEHRNQCNSPWAPEVERVMIRLWHDGMLTKDIAVELNKRFGLSLTKSSITTKARRMSLPHRKGVLSVEERNERRKATRKLWCETHRAQVNEYRRKRRALLRSAAPHPVFDPTKPRNAANNLWSPEVLSRLRDLWSQDIPLISITATLCAEFGPLSYKAVLQKSHRLGLVNRQILGREGHFKWETQHHARLDELWSEGFSGSAIAETMTQEFSRPFTRNSILGRARKLGLPERQKGGGVAETDPAILAARADEKRRKDRERKRAQYVARPRQPRIRRESPYQQKIKLRKLAPSIEDFAIPTPQRKTLMQLEAHDCRWPVGEPKSDQFFFCGAVAEDNRPYCSAHCKRAYIETRIY